MFIQRDDLSVAIRQYDIDSIIGGDDTLVDIAIISAISEMRPYLYRYDCDTIFGATGKSRHPLMVRFAVDIAVFELCSICLPNQDLENRRALYNRAINWLKDIKNNETPTDLPLLPEAEAPVMGTITFGGTPARDNRL